MVQPRTVSAAANWVVFGTAVRYALLGVGLVWSMGLGYAVSVFGASATLVF